MIRHIVILHFKKSYNQDYVQLLENTKPFITQIPGIVSYKIYKNESHYTGWIDISAGIFHSRKPICTHL